MLLLEKPDLSLPPTSTHAFVQQTWSCTKSICTQNDFWSDTMIYSLESLSFPSLPSLQLPLFFSTFFVPFLQRLLSSPPLQVVASKMLRYIAWHGLAAQKFRDISPPLVKISGVCRQKSDNATSVSNQLVPILITLSSLSSESDALLRSRRLPETFRGNSTSSTRSLRHLRSIISIVALQTFNNQTPVFKLA